MNLTLKKLQKTSKGWMVIFLIDLEAKNISLFLNKYSRYLRDYEIIIKNKKLYLKRYFQRLEPWEDETTEAVVKSIELELKALINK